MKSYTIGNTLEEREYLGYEGATFKMSLTNEAALNEAQELIKDYNLLRVVKVEGLMFYVESLHIWQHNDYLGKLDEKRLLDLTTFEMLNRIGNLK
jgi:hypothetical protein